jgi:hypothetical protein
LEVWGQNPLIKIKQNPAQAGDPSLTIEAAGANNNATVNIGGAVLQSNTTGHSLFINPSGLGYVGIGTPSPSTLLHLESTNDPAITIKNTGMAGSPSLLVAMNAGNDAALLQTTGNKGFRFYNGQYALVIHTNGNVCCGPGSAPQSNIALMGYTATASHAAVRAHHAGNGASPGIALQASNGYGETSGGYEIFAVYGNNWSTRVASVLDDWALRYRLKTSQPSDALLANQDIVMYLASNTSLRFRVRGTDGTVREGTITLT